MKAICIDSGPHHQYKVGKVYDYTIKCGVCIIKGTINVSAKFFEHYFKPLEDGNKEESSTLTSSGKEESRQEWE